MKHAAPILFLDIDGVLNRHATKAGDAGVRTCVLQRPYSLTQHTGVVETAKVEALARMLLASGAKIVVSSSWREGLADAAAFAAAIGLVPPLANAPDLIHRDWRTGWKPSSHRHHEIGWWLDKHPRVTRHAIVDDHDFIPPEWPMASHFIKTDPNVGLTNHALNRALEMFGRSDLARDWFEPAIAEEGAQA